MKEKVYIEATVNSPELTGFYRLYDPIECTEDPRIFCSVSLDDPDGIHPIYTADFRLDGQKTRLYVSDVEHQLRYYPTRFNSNVDCTEVYEIADGIWAMVIYFEA